MEDDFKLNRLRKLTKPDLLKIIGNPKNAVLFKNYTNRDLEAMGTVDLINLIASSPAAHIDNNYGADRNHIEEARAFDTLYEYLMQGKRQRVQQLDALTKEQLVTIMGYTANSEFFDPEIVKELERNISTTPKELIVSMIRRYPAVTLTGNVADRTWDPEYWTPKPNQVDHIDRLVNGCTDPRNEARFIWDGSETGRGKTISAILIAIKLKVRYIVVIGPDSVLKNWHDALSPLGLFDYRICTYDGIKGTNSRADFQYAKHKPNPYKLNYLEEFDWVSIRKNTATGAAKKDSHIYDWSNLPGRDPATGMGGCLVVWDEVQNAKGKTSKIGVCFKHFVKNLQGEPVKYLRGLATSATIMEKVDDLPYMMYALGYIVGSADKDLNSFVNNKLTPNFKELLGDEWVAEKHAAAGPAEKLILFLRIVAMRQNKFSEIPDIIPYILHRIGYIYKPYAEYVTDFIDKTVVPRFRELMGRHWTPELDGLEKEKKLLKFLRTIVPDPRFAYLNIDDILDRIFDNPITFQGLKVQDDDLNEFMRINREIEILLIEIIRGNKTFDSGYLGKLQETMSELEILKLTPFTELARKALFTPLANGGRGSVCISMLRNASCRYFAWRMEAILMVDLMRSSLQQGKTTEAELVKYKEAYIVAVLHAQNEYAELEKRNIAAGLPLEIKSSFKKNTVHELLAMNMENVCMEYNRWIKYLDVENFQFVCIFVGNFGSPAPTGFDLESDDINDHIKQSKAMKRQTREDVKELFQNNIRRVFITNMQISREGINLHDTSPGGMHPRTAIISPGLTARYLVQMLGRFVREGQSSETIRICGYIDDVKGTVSWEARFMETLAMKVKQIQLLHKGEVNLDIMKNIDEGAGSMMQAVLDEIRLGKVRMNTYGMPAITSPSTPTDSPAPSGSRFAGTVAVTEDTFGDYIQKTLGTRVTPMKPINNNNNNNVPQSYGSGRRLEPQISSTVESYRNKIHVGFHNPNSTIPGFTDRVVEFLVGLNLNSIYYRVATRNEHKPSVIIYKKGMTSAKLTDDRLTKGLEAKLALPVIVKDVPDSYYNSEQFTPEIQGVVLKGAFESTESIILSPAHPLIDLFPRELASVAGLEASLPNTPDPKEQGTIVRFKGTPNSIVLTLYACKLIALYGTSGEYTSLMVGDPLGVMSNIPKEYFISIGVVNGKHVITASVQTIQMFGLCFASLPAMTDAIRNKLVFDIDSYAEADGKASLIVMPEYVDFMIKFLGPRATSEKK